MPTNIGIAAQVNSHLPLEESNPEQVKIVGISGSLRPDSHTYQALNFAAQRVASLGASVEVLDLRTLTLPFCDGLDNYSEYPDVEKLRRTVKQANGLILATPEYHGSLSGVLKNALDLMSFEQLDGKVVGAISVLGGEQNSNALNDLRLIVRWVHGWVIPEQIAVGRAWQAFDQNGQIKDEKLRQRFDDFARSLVENTRKLNGLAVPQALQVEAN
ncbi:NADPH-dependent FMN reductase [Leptolyngbya sp. FACHB-261]|uniref:NADPH-dependent FMN reductase n=1 Tax=Leptolyngbya sp. FACHB-261 TaxID=2692806 RepID=UPI001681D1F4|nr:NADPH-dependent FMN reductase [Leptolyngbya sp. FACHB-261]MBD2102460.1 NAD(P)H-dependent oxidoreductase [Leptolyngbya sp. FACHB-261]